MYILGEHSLINVGEYSRKTKIIKVVTNAEKVGMFTVSTQDTRRNLLATPDTHLILVYNKTYNSGRNTNDIRY